MALLPPGRLRVTTAAGAPVSGGKLRIYNAGTTTLTNVYTTAALTTPLTNPVVAGSDGFLPQINAAEGTLVDLDYLTAGDVVISGQSCEDVAFLGANSGSFTRDLTGSRVAIRNVAGVVYFEAGNATGDDVGGDWRLGGWNGTQADTGVLDAATINTTTDAFTVNSKKLGGVVSTAATTFTAQTAVDIPLTNTPTGTRAWEVTIFDLLNNGGAASSNLLFRFSYDNGLTYKSGAADYSYAQYGVAGSTADNRNSTGLSSIQAMVDFFTPTDKPGLVKLEIVTPNSGSFATRLHAKISGHDGAGTPLVHVTDTAGFGLGGYGRATHVRMVLANAGTLTGKYRVEALRGFGE